MSAYGTAGVIKFVNRDNVQSMPTHNYRLGTFRTADSLSGQRIAELAPERGGKGDVALYGRLRDQVRHRLQ